MSVDKELITSVRCCWNCFYRRRIQTTWVCNLGIKPDDWRDSVIEPSNLCPFHEDRRPYKTGV